MFPFEYHKVSADEVEQLGNTFVEQHGDEAHGIIPDAEYDRLFDHLAEALRRYGAFEECSGTSDFSGSRYVDQVSWITTVPRSTATPSAALAAALEAVSTSHRPLAVSFDFYPEALLILPPNRVFTTFEQSVLTPET